MRVLFIHNTISEYRFDFFRSLSKIVNLDILVTDKNLASSIYGLSFDCNNKELNIFYVSKIKEIKKHIQQKKYDIVVLPPVDTLYQWICAYCAYKESKGRQIRFIYWTEKWEPEKKLQPLKKIIKNYIQSCMIGFFVKRANRCIAAGSKSYYYLQRIGVNKKKISIAYDSSTSPICLREIDIRKKYHIPKNSKIVLFLGRIVSRKGCLDLIYAFSIVSQKYSNTYLLICGDGPSIYKCKKAVDDMQYSNIVFTGKIEPYMRANYYKQSDVFVLPSFSQNGVVEAWGLTVNESLEQGTPVVATTAVGAVYDISDGKCCLMVKEHIIEDLAKGIIQMIESEDIKKTCLERYKVYSVENMVRMFKEAFDRTL